jgi:hypothetical protein
MLEGLRALREDSATEIIVLISKPPAQSARDRVLEAASRCGKPCVISFLGEQEERASRGNIHMEDNLESTALRILKLLGKEPPGWAFLDDKSRKQIESIIASTDPGHRSIRGLYSGGTLCYESLFILRNLGHQAGSGLEREQVGGDLLIDMGDDRYTVGRPHPMIDFRSRCDALVQAAADPEVGVVLLDVILGYGAHPDPAAQLATVRDVIGEVDARHLPEIVAINKSDLLDDDARLLLRGLVPGAVFVSAKTGEGVDELRARIANTAMDILGREGALSAENGDLAPFEGRAEFNFRLAPIFRFGGGTNEIQRDIVASAGLGLAR